jgi:uncharacterized protein
MTMEEVMRFSKRSLAAALALAALTIVQPALFAGEAPKAPAPGNALVGSWVGAMKNGNRSFFMVSRRWDGGLKASYGDIEKKVSAAPMQSVALVDGTVKIVAPKLQISFEGSLSADGKKIEGRLKTGRWQTPITLEKVSVIPGPKRPQTPHGPYPYQERIVHYRNEAAKITLVGTLTLPKQGGPFPAVLLIPGSGPNDRNEEAMFHRPFEVIADYLTRRGIAVLRVDKRGVGESEGDWTKADVNVLAGDVVVGLKYLATLPEIDPKRMGVLGQSEGGEVGPAAAVMSSDVSFVVALAGAATNWLDLLVAQDGAIAVANGASEEQAEIIRAWSRRFYTIAVNTPDKAEARKQLKEMKAKRTPQEREAYSFLPPVGTLDVDTLLQDSVLGNFRLDAGPTLAKVKCPILMLFGEKDCQVPAKVNSKAAEDAFKASGNKEAKVITLPGMNHCFQRCTTGAEGEYGEIEETIAPDVLKLFGDWIEAHTKAQKQPAGPA